MGCWSKHPLVKWPSIFLYSIFAFIVLVRMVLLLPVHFTLKAMGKKGFVVKEVELNERMTWTFVPSSEGFKKAPL